MISRVSSSRLMDRHLHLAINLVSFRFGMLVPKRVPYSSNLILTGLVVLLGRTFQLFQLDLKIHLSRPSISGRRLNQSLFMKVTKQRFVGYNGAQMVNNWLQVEMTIWLRYGISSLRRQRWHFLTILLQSRLWHGVHTSMVSCYLVVVILIWQSSSGIPKYIRKSTNLRLDPKYVG